jgi:hypothetical protein
MSRMSSVLERRIHAAALHEGKPDVLGRPSLEGYLNKCISQISNVPSSFDIHSSIRETAPSG